MPSPEHSYWSCQIRPTPYFRIGRAILFWSKIGKPEWGYVHGVLARYLNLGRVVLGWENPRG